MPVQNCLLCDKESSYKVVDHGKAKKFDCPHCHVFIVSGDVEHKLPELNQNLIKKMSLYSSTCPSDQIFHIHSDECANIIAHCVPELTI